jgi:hypothetical protein
MHGVESTEGRWRPGPAVRAGRGWEQRHSGLKVALQIGALTPAGAEPMNATMNAAASQVEFRFNSAVGDHECPLCGASFHTTPGSWPFLAGTVTPVCGGPDCPVAEDAPDASPCDTLFAFCDLAADTLRALAATDEADSVPERLRRVALDESLPEADRGLLNRAAIDLLFWEADQTRIAALEPRLVLQTCPEAAAEMLLSGCGDIV